jgi:hypothetical protein
MRLHRAARALLLAPFGGERALVEGARRRARAVFPSKDSYDEARQESTDSRSGGQRLAFASLVLVLSAGERTERLRELVRELPPGGFAAVIDHNAPRPAVPRALAWLHLAVARALLGGEDPATRLRRSLARELRDLGLEVVRLRLLAAEFFQVVIARKPPASV